MRKHAPTYTAHLEDSSPVLPLIQDVIKAMTWIFTVLLAFRGLLAFYGAKQASWLEQTADFVTAPLIMPFRNLFADPKAGEQPIFISMLWVIFVGILLYMLVGFIAKYSYMLKVQKKTLTSTRKLQS